MVTIVVDTGKEKLNKFRADNNIPDDVVLITKSEYENNKKTYENYAILNTQEINLFDKIPEIEMLPTPSKIEMTQGRTIKQKKEQDKWRKRYGYKK